MARGAHAFTNMATPLGAIAIERTISWINAILERTPGADAADDDGTPESDDAAPVAVVRRFIDQVVNRANFAALDDIWATNLVWHGGSMGDIHGLDAFKQHMTANAGNAFTNMHLHIDDIVATGDKVVLRFTNSGTQSGPFMGTPASGKHAAWLGIGIYTVVDGKIAEAWFGEDILGMMLQLGVIQLPAA